MAAFRNVMRRSIECTVCGYEVYDKVLAAGDDVIRFITAEKCHAHLDCAFGALAGMGEHSSLYREGTQVWWNNLILPRTEYYWDTLDSLVIGPARLAAGDEIMLVRVQGLIPELSPTLVHRVQIAGIRRLVAADFRPMR